MADGEQFVAVSRSQYVMTTTSLQLAAPSITLRRIVVALTLLLVAALSRPAHAQLVNGGSVNGSITTAGGSDTYSFTATAGESYLLRLVDVNTTGFRPRITLLDPLGNTVATDTDTDVAALGGAAALTGAYQVTVADGNSTPVTGAYRLYFVLAPGANEGGALPSGSSVSGAIDRGDLDSYTFAMTAGESYVLRFSDTNSSGLFARMILYGPTGEFIAQDSDANVAALGDSATQTGTYTVVVLDGSSSPAQTGGYELHFVRAPGATSGGALPSGGIVSGNIGLGEVESYNFTIQAGESYLVRASDTNGTGLRVRMLLYDPRGCFVAQDSDTDVAALGGAAAFTGDYTVVVVDGNSSPAQTGAYNIHYTRIPGATSGGALSSGSVVTGALGLGELDSFRFSIEAGQSYQLRASDSNGTALRVRMLLYDPRGGFVAEDADANVAALGGVATLTGDYTVVLVDGNSSPAQTGPYELYFVGVPGGNSGGPLANRGVVSGTIQQGEIESFCFDIEAGESYFVRVVDTLSSGLFPRVILYDSRGDFVAQDSASTVATVAGTALFSGAYTVLILDGSSSPAQSGDFEVHFAKAVGANERGYLLDGIAADEMIDLGDVDSYTFLAQAGDAAQVTMTDTLSGSLFPTVRLYGPGGQFIAQASNSTSAVLNHVAAFDGTYTLLAYDGTSAATGTGPYSLVVTGSGRLGNSGCDREGTTVFSGAPSASAGFSMAAPDFTRNCSIPPFVALGLCAPAPALLPNGLTCGICGLQLANVGALELSPFVVPPLPGTAVGLTFCTQALCFDGPCIVLSASTEFTLR